MSRLMRLENTQLGVSPFVLTEDVDKIIEFDDGILTTHQLDHSYPLPFDANTEKMRAFVEQKIHKKADQPSVRLIRNMPVINAYSAPFKLYIDVTTACGLNCSFCLSDAGKKTATHLPMSVVRSLSSEMKKLGVMYVKIGGGNPLLHPLFEEIVTNIRSAGCFITMSLNSEELNSKVVELLADAKVRVSVSIEGLEETNDSFRGSGHFHRALDTLRHLKRRGVDVLLRVTLLRQNLREVRGLIDLARSEAVRIKFAYCRPAGRAVKNGTLLGISDYAEYLQTIECLNREATKTDVLMDEGMMLIQPKEISPKLFRGIMCGAANRSMHVDAYGRVSPCIFLGSGYSFGEIYRDGNLADFWHGNVGESFQRVRSICQPHECDGCDRICKNECIANRLYFWNDATKQDPYCLQSMLKKFGRGL